MRTLLIAPLLLTVCSWAGAAELRTLVVDRPHSQVDVAVKATMDSFTAQLQNYDATVTVDPATGQVISATVRFKFTDVKTGKDARDEEMNHWQETNTFPNGVFNLTSLSPVANGHHTANGTLEFHGIQRAITFPVSIKTEGALWAVDGEAPLDTREFGLRVFRKFAVMRVSPLLTVRFHLQGTLVPEKSAGNASP